MSKFGWPNNGISFVLATFAIWRSLTHCAMPPRVAVILCLLLAVVLPASAQFYGLNTRPSFTAFNNGALPPNASTITGTWSTVPVWPSLTFQNPLGIVQEPGTQSMIVWEREGRVYRFDKATGANKTLILDLSANTQGWDDCGMLNLVFHPNYATNKYVFIYYVWVPAGTVKGSSTARVPLFTRCWNRLSRFTVDGSGQLTNETVLIHQKCQTVWHHGSGMFFHPDNGFLYFIVGEDFVTTNAQKLDGGLLSGIFRIDVDNRGGSISHAIPRQPLPGPADDTGSYTANYMIPNDNPLVGQSGVLEEYFALGVRSPHRLTYDAATGRMFHSDVGDASREEINVVEPGDVLPNYQWPKFEGLVGSMTAPFIGQDKQPVLDYTHADGSAVIGGLVYHGNEFPELKGKYIFGDNMNGMIWYLDESTTPASKIAIAKVPNGPGPNAGDNYVGISHFGVDADGELLITRMSYTGGTVLKLSRTGGNPNTMPATLSATNIFSDLGTLATSTGFIAYDVNTPLWSDAALKQRWFAVPSGQRIGYSPTGEWSFPTGSVFVKHFDLVTDETNNTKRRLETRILVRDNQGFVYGGSYKWRADNSDADLVSDTQDENIAITGATGTRMQTWTYPGRSACFQCHTQASKGVLGLSTPQNHRDHLFTETGITDNQLRAWNHAGYFTPSIDEATLPTLTKFAAIDDSGASLETRVRSYLDSNCAHCHRPGGVNRASWDARIETPLANAGIIDGAVLNDLGAPGSRIITPQDVAKSVLHKRLATASDSYAMPPIAKHLVDDSAVTLVEQWINNLTPATPQPVAAPWVTAVIAGAGGATGSATTLGPSFRISHATAPTPPGAVPEQTAFFAGQPITSGAIMAKLVSRQQSLNGVPVSDSDASFSISVRGSLATGAAHGDLGSPGVGQWILVERSGTLLKTRFSSDGMNWGPAGSLTVSPLPTTAYLGFAARFTNSDTPGYAGEAVFEDVRVMPLVPWAYSSQPSSQLVRVGDLVEFGVETSGLPPTSYQWRKGTSNISRAVSSRYGFKAALASAGSYNVLTGGKLASNSANLIVLDKVTYTNNLAPNGTSTFTLSYAGTGAGFVWTKDGVPLQNSTHIVGANTGKLSIKALTLADIGDYECVVSAFGTTQVMGPYHLHVLSKPTITAAAPPAWSVSRAFAWQLGADEPTTSYVVTGLPSGLSYNTITGLVSGTPNVGGSFSVHVYAKNAAGSGAVTDYTLNIDSLPSSIPGSYAGIVDRVPANSDLGGQISLTVAPSGVVTGKLWSGTVTYSLTGRALFVSGSDPTVTISSPALSIVLHETDATISGTAFGASLSARHVLRSTPSAHAGTYYAAIDPTAPGNLSQPQGSGWARLIVGSTGTVTISGSLPEGSVLTSSAIVLEDGCVAWRQVLHGNKGSIQGMPSFAAGALTGGLDWLKTGKASSTDRTYAAGFPLTTLTVDGLKFAAPASGTTFLGNADASGNARIEFTFGGIGSAAVANVPDQTFWLTSSHKAVFDGVATNPCLDTMSITGTSGCFTGSLKLTDGALLRTVSYQGVFLPGRNQAHGAFRLVQLPGNSTSPILSGAVLIKALP